MTDIPLPTNFLKPRRKPPAEPQRRRVPHIESWAGYGAARISATNRPGPDGEADRQAALRFAAEQMPADIASVYFEDMRRR